MNLRTKFCVIGTGAGGGMLAYHLAKSGADVLVLNSGTIPKQSIFQNEMTPEQQGHFEILPDTKFIAKSSVALVHPLIADATSKSSDLSSQERFHQYQIHHVNGLQNFWNAVSLRFSKDDFANRHSYNDQCQWPISYEDLAPHYSAVEKLAHVIGAQDHLPQIPDGSFDVPRGPRDVDEIFLRANKKLFGPHLYHIANRKAVDLRSDSSQKCVACGNCARGCRSASVYKFSTHLLPQIKNLNNFKLIENTRVVKIVSENSSASEVIALDETTNKYLKIKADVVVLCSGAIESPRIILNSFVNGTEQVGLYLQDNPPMTLGTSLFRLWFKSIKEDRGYGDHILLGGSHQSVPFVASFLSSYMKIPHYLPDIQFVPRPLRPLIARQIYRSTAVLMFFTPAIPRRENRITLGAELDRFSQRQVQIQYEVAKKEKENHLKLEVLGRKMLRNASGYIADTIKSPPGGGVHYVGTCRMGLNPDKGVVDKNLKFFGSNNFYVCDGSVIPVLNEKHPTLTIMALAHRLGDHLIERYK